MVCSDPSPQSNKEKSRNPYGTLHRNLDLYPPDCRVTNHEEATGHSRSVGAWNRKGQKLEVPIKSEV